MCQKLNILLCELMLIGYVCHVHAAEGSVSRSNFTLLARDLDLHLDKPVEQAKMQPTIPSVLFEASNRAAPPHQLQLHELDSDQQNSEWEYKARIAAQNTQLINDNSACVSRQGNNTGAGISWSLNDGFGFYWQGRGLRELQRLIGGDELSDICPPGDPSPMCKSIPKRMCN